MARAFILGHGSRDPAGEKTFVPAGKSISFYSKVDENTLRATGLAALNAGDIPPVEKFDAESEVYNYRLSRFEDDAIAEHMASESSLTGGATYFIGLETSFGTTPLPSPLLLCTAPQECARTKPRHSPVCKGLFALVPEDEVVSVTCRGVRGQKSPATSRLGAQKLDDSGHDTSEDFTSETTAEGKRLLALSKTDPVAAIAQIESLSEPTRRILFANVYALELFVVDYYKKGGAATPEAVLEARRALDALGEDSFADHVDKYEAKQKQMVLADGDLKAAYDRGVKKRTQTRLKQQRPERERPLIGQHRGDASQNQGPKKAQPERERPRIGQHRGDRSQKQGIAPVASGVGAVSRTKEVDRAVKLLELSKKKTKDPYRAVAISRLIEALPGSVKAAAESILGG